MGDDEKKEDETPAEGLSSEEAIEFLKLVEEAKAAGNEPGPLEPTPSPKPRKRFRLKSRGKKKKDVPTPTGTTEVESPKRPQPTKISEEKLMEILKGAEEPPNSLSQPTPKKRTPSKKSANVSLAFRKKDSHWLEGLLAIALIALLAKTFWPSTLTLKNPPTDPVPSVATMQRQPPDMTAIYFTRALSLRHYSEALDLMSSERQSQLTVTALESSVSQYLSENPDSLDTVRVASVQKDKGSTQVTLKVGPAQTIWEMTLLQQGDRWVVHDLGGGPSL
jgi:hypothetical protein